MADDTFSNIREILGGMLGQRLVDITQHDCEEWEEGSEAYVCLHFANGVTLRFYVTDAGFEVEGLEDDEDPPDPDGRRRYTVHG